MDSNKYTIQYVNTLNLIFELFAIMKFSPIVSNTQWLLMEDGSPLSLLTGVVILQC